MTRPIVIKPDDPQDQNTRLRRASGTVKSKDKLVAFLYTLMRDHLPTATVEQLVREQLPPNGETAIYTNGWLAKYAQDLAKRLK